MYCSTAFVTDNVMRHMYGVSLYLTCNLHQPNVISDTLRYSVLRTKMLVGIQVWTGVDLLLAELASPPLLFELERTKRDIPTSCNTSLTAL